ncbi:hypothetical protein ACQP00_18520 [Dactylosporangium sp. CS-047395]|uniref:hypothetical protein n=1 Tax=Dactylosporangium sp. CS-047395 TaxID=3239936 RepID=UPI003D8FAFB7
MLSNRQEKTINTFQSNTFTHEAIAAVRQLREIVCRSAAREVEELDGEPASWWYRIR